MSNSLQVSITQGGGPEKEKKKDGGLRGHFFCFFSFPGPPPQQPRVLFAYSFTLLSPFSSPIRKLLIAHAFPQIHEPPYPPFIIVLIARNLSGRIAASKNLKNHTYAKMGAPQRPFLQYYIYYIILYMYYIYIYIILYYIILYEIIYIYIYIFCILYLIYIQYNILYIIYSL